MSFRVGHNLKATWRSTGTLIERKTKGHTSPSRITMKNKTRFKNAIVVARHDNKK